MCVIADMLFLPAIRSSTLTSSGETSTRPTATNMDVTSRRLSARMRPSMPSQHRMVKCSELVLVVR
jgi:hypothetical protein